MTNTSNPSSRVIPRWIVKLVAIIVPLAIILGVLLASAFPASAYESTIEVEPTPLASGEIVAPSYANYPLAVTTTLSDVTVIESNYYVYYYDDPYFVNCQFGYDSNATFSDVSSISIGYGIASDYVAITIYGAYYAKSPILGDYLLPSINLFGDFTTADVNVHITYEVITPTDTTYYINEPLGTMSSMIATSGSVANHIYGYISSTLTTESLATGLTITYDLPSPEVTNVYIENPQKQTYTESFIYNADIAYEDGYLDGEADGIFNTYQPAYEEGYTNGYDLGYDDGYLEGQESNVNGIEWMLKILDTCLNFPLVYFPNGTALTAGSIVGVLLGLPLLIWFLKMFAGG